MFKKFLLLLSSTMLAITSFTSSIYAINGMTVHETLINPRFYAETTESPVDGYNAYAIYFEYDGDNFADSKDAFNRYTGTSVLTMQIDITHDAAETIGMADNSDVLCTQPQGAGTTLSRVGFNGAKGKYYAIPSGSVVATLYIPSTSDVNGIEITLAQVAIDTHNINNTTYQTVYSSATTDVDGGYADAYAYIGKVADPVLTGVTFDTADATKNATTATVAGEATYTLPAVYAVYDSETVDSTAVDAEWSVTGGGSIADGIYTAPAAPAYGEDDLTITLTATYEGQTATVTVTVPASTVAPAFSATPDYTLASYYTAEGKEFKRIGCTLANSKFGKLNLKFTNNADAEDYKDMEVDYPVVGGNAQSYFEAWIFNAPSEGVTLEVTEVQ